MICTSPWNRLAKMSVATFLVTLATSAQAQEQTFKAVSVKTPDGLTISAQDWGNPNGPEILFIHGFSQSHLSWIKQVTNRDLAKDLRPARSRQFRQAARTRALQDLEILGRRGPGCDGCDGLEKAGAG